MAFVVDLGMAFVDKWAVGVGEGWGGGGGCEEEWTVSVARCSSIVSISWLWRIGIERGLRGSG